MEDLVKTYLVITDVIAHQVLPEGNAIQVCIIVSPY